MGNRAPGQTEPATPAATRSRELFAIVAVTRGKHVAPMRMGYQFREGDVAAGAIHKPDHAEATQVLRTFGWHALGKK